MKNKYIWEIGVNFYYYFMSPYKYDLMKVIL
jgi:hypothetical protein